jgi:hypothetical protein
LTLSGVERSDQDPRFQKNYTNRIPIGRMAKAHEYNGGGGVFVSPTPRSI